MFLETRSVLELIIKGSATRCGKALSFRATLSPSMNTVMFLGSTPTLLKRGKGESSEPSSSVQFTESLVHNILQSSTLKNDVKALLLSDDSSASVVSIFCCSLSLTIIYLPYCFFALTLLCTHLSYGNIYRPIKSPLQSA